MKKNYIDIDLNFKAHPISGDVNLLTGSDVVKSNIKNLIFTNFYEKPYSPNYGGNIRQYLFSKINSLDKEVIKSELNSLLKQYEPRIDDTRIKVNILENNTLEVSIYFTIVSISEEQVLNIVLNRIR